MMCRWLPEEDYNIPPFAHTMVGVGAVVVNDKHQVLVVNEKNALVKDSWKLPGGYLERSKLNIAITQKFSHHLIKFQTRTSSTAGSVKFSKRQVSKRNTKR